MSQILGAGMGVIPPADVIETLTADVGGAVPPTANNIDIVGGENINTSGNPGTSTITVNLNEVIRLPETNAAGTQGVIYWNATGGVGGVPIFHNFDDSGVDASSLFVGENAGNFTNTGTENVGIGNSCLNLISNGEANTALGADALANLVGGFNNVAAGTFALLSLNDGAVNGNSSYNTVLGCSAGINLLTGASNIIIGGGNGTAESAAGDSYTGAESDNILIGNVGVTGESHVIRIGQHDATPASQQNTCFIAGIFGQTVNGGTGTAVFVDSTGQLGTIVSSKRFKDDILDIKNKSEGIYELRPVSFLYKLDESKRRQFGLIAEEVDKIMPELVSYDADKRPYSVRYEQLPVLLLNELQKQQVLIDALLKRINLLEERIED